MDFDCRPVWARPTLKNGTLILAFYSVLCLLMVLLTSICLASELSEETADTNIALCLCGLCSWCNWTHSSDVIFRKLPCESVFQIFCEPGSNAPPPKRHVEFPRHLATEFQRLHLCFRDQRSQCTYDRRRPSPEMNTAAAKTVQFCASVDFGRCWS